MDEVNSCLLSNLGELGEGFGTPRVLKREDQNEAENTPFHHFLISLIVSPLTLGDGATGNIVVRNAIAEGCRSYSISIIIP